VRVHWSERAQAQLRDIFQYIVRDRPRAASGLLVSLHERVELLVEFPEQGKLWDEGARPDLREILFESYRVVYRVDPGEIFILSVRHTRMQRSDNVEEGDP
jgi:toxin ParE1/3/4